MLFSSFVFLSLFLPLTLACYYAVPPKARNAVLLAASMVFYAWGDFNYLGIMLGTVLVDYFGAIVLEGVPPGRPRLRKLALALFVSANLSVLFYFKYFNFVMDNLSAAVGLEWTLRRIVMPLGISFYTFQGLSYLVDVYRREIPAQRDLPTLALFIAYFPQLVAGPILKYHDVCREMECRSETPDHFAYGARRFVMGFAKKVLVANSMAVVADSIFGEPANAFGPLAAWGGAVAYSLQLYFDFSGYSDMAIGLGAMFGFHFLENFNYPYSSLSVTEFWRRWHISLSTWFKEYLYIPLGGNRVTKARNLFNLAVVFLATGIWHGAEWTFVLWGAFHGMFILLEKLTGWHKKLDGPWQRSLHRAYLLLVVVFGWVLFRADGIAYAFDYMRNMFGLLPVVATHGTAYYFTHFNCFMMLVAAILSAGACKRLLPLAAASPWRQFLLDAWLLALLVLSMSFLAGASYNPFIYFRF
ncbi:MAG: MBOAT family protein [Kiritimatiellae bacterium]|nr:MBOAT family protein [Kiritimatiellia bacterium]